MTALTGTDAELDQVCAAAADIARQAVAAEVGEAFVGEHLGAVPDGQRVVTHLFACLQPGYPGWQWSVTLARASGAQQVTVSEVVLTAGEDALLAPTWVPWSDRLRSGDMSAGFVMPTDPQDERLAPGWSGQDELTGALDDAPLHPVNWEPWLARPRVLSQEGRRDAASRWYGGDHGPHASIARAAARQCSTCGWLLLIGGPLGQVFGVCSHLLSPSDGKVVSFDHGCGAHSEASAHQRSAPRAEHRVDDYGRDSLDFGHS